MAKLSSARVASMSKNPGTRSKVPTSQLAPKYRRMRKANEAAKVANDPAALTAPMTPHTLGQQVTAASNLAYGGAEQQLGQQAAQSQQIQGQIPQYFADYMASLNRATDTTKQAYGAAIGVQQNGINTMAGLDAQNASQMQTGMQANAAASGQTVDPATLQLATQAALSRRQTATDQQGLTAGLGAGQTAYRAGQETVGAGQQLTARLDEGARGRVISGKRLQLAKDKGNFAVTTRQKLIDAEHTKQLENKAFDLNTVKAANDVSIAKAGLETKVGIANQTSADRQAALATRESVASADRAARAREGHLTRLTRKETAHTIANAGNISPAERKSRTTAVAGAENSRSKATNRAKLYVQHGIKDASTLRTALEQQFPGSPKEVIDVAMSDALKGKQGTSGQSYRKYLKDLAAGKRSK